MNNRRCDRCMSWEKTELEDRGFCRRYAPHPVAGDSVFAGWPLTEPSDGCGEYNYDGTKDKENA